MDIVGILITVVVAIIVYVLLSYVSTIVAIIGAVLVLIAGIPSGGFGLGSRFGGGRGAAGPRR